MIFSPTIRSSSLPAGNFKSSATVGSFMRHLGGMEPLECLYAVVVDGPLSRAILDGFFLHAHLADFAAAEHADDHREERQNQHSNSVVCVVAHPRPSCSCPLRDAGGFVGASENLSPHMRGLKQRA